MKGGNKNQDGDSSEEEQPIDRKDPLAMEKQKNSLLMDRLFKSEKQLTEMKETYEAIAGDVDHQKDKKIIDLAKKNRALQLQAESLKAKAAKAAEFALSLKKQSEDDTTKSSPAIKQSPASASAGASRTKVDLTMSKELEKKMVKLRNDN